MIAMWRGTAVVLRVPDGSAETLEMSVNGNSAQLEVTPTSSGIYGIEVNVTAQVPDGAQIDRAAFLSFEVQPVDKQITTARLLVGVGIVILLFVIFILLVGTILLKIVRKRRTG